VTPDSPRDETLFRCYRCCLTGIAGAACVYAKSNSNRISSSTLTPRGLRAFTGFTLARVDARRDLRRAVSFMDADGICSCSFFPPRLVPRSRASGRRDRLDNEILSRVFRKVIPDYNRPEVVRIFAVVEQRASRRFHDRLLEDYDLHGDYKCRVATSRRCELSLSSVQRGAS
jgi:hypothetical protein